MHRLALMCLALAMWVASALAQAPQASPNAQASANAIDRWVSRRWQEHGVQPAALADDAEFMRRVYLDLAGCIPPVSEVREFLDDPSPDKRVELVDRLLTTPAYVTHFTNVWRSWLLSEAETSFEARFLVPGFEVWLRKRLVENRPYDRLVQEILTTKTPQRNQPFFGGDQGEEPTPMAFFQAKENKPENLAAASARLFLGVRVECAQCHDHPFARWKRHDFWSHAAFFAGVEPESQNGLFSALRRVFDRREIAVPGTKEIVEARYLTGGQPTWEFGVPARQTLAAWITARDNPYFARAAVNRLWSQFFGIGLVEPVDDMDEHNRASHPELLDELSRAFADSGYDLKFLIRSIALSRTYQLSSRTSHDSQHNPRLFARTAVRGLSSEQLLDSLMQATGFDEPRGSRNPFAQNPESPRAEIMEHFAGQGQTTEHQTSILQALALMNGRLMTSATTLQSSKTLAAVAECPLLDTPGKVEALYLAALGRGPRSDESAKLVKYVDEALPDSSKALANVFWALLNSSEFVLNH